MNRYVFFVLCFLSLLPASTNAQMKNITNSTKNVSDISVTGYMNYPPFGYIEEVFSANGKNKKDVYRSVFEDVIKELQDKSDLRVKYLFSNKTPEDKYLQGINLGKIDVFLGIYFDTKEFQRAEPVYPALISNPVIVITMSDNAQKINDIAQLKNMKGAVCKQDHFSDFVKKQMKEYSLEYVDTPLKTFEKLYTGEVDYIFSTQYFGIIEASNLGIRNYLSFSQQKIWDMPVFIGISRLSPSRKFLVEKLSSYSQNPENKTKMENKLHEMIQNIELKNRGVVPPAFIKKEISDMTTSTLDLSNQADKIKPDILQDN